LKATPEEIIESLIYASKNPDTSIAAMMALMAHVNDYKINDLVGALAECGVLKLNDSQ